MASRRPRPSRCSTSAPPPRPHHVLRRRTPAQVYDVRLPSRTAPRGTHRRRRARRLLAAGVRPGPRRGQAQAFADDGFHGGVEYRRPGMPGGGWPGTADDVAAAVTAVRRDPDLARPARPGRPLRRWPARRLGRRPSPGPRPARRGRLAGVVDLARRRGPALGDTAAPPSSAATPAAPRGLGRGRPGARSPRRTGVFVHGATTTWCRFESRAAVCRRRTARPRAPHAGRGLAGTTG